MTSTPATYRAGFAIGDEQAAKGVVDVLTEVFFEGEAAVAAFERPDGRWDVTVHFADPPDQALVRELVAGAAGEEVANGIAFDTVEAKDWVAASLEDLIPVPAGRFVVHGQHDRARSPNKLGIEIEAALAFGTGHHGTTRGCLLLLDHVLKAWRPRRVLDLGTGTGVLGIAAAKALHEKVLASDIDPPSVRVARDNARLNTAGHLVQAISATGFGAPQFALAGPFDLVLANILANPLRQLAGPMLRHLAPSALVILSGLLTPQAPAVIAAYRARGLVPVRHLRIEGGAACCCVRRVENYLDDLKRATTPLSFSPIVWRARRDEAVEYLDDHTSLFLVDDGRARAAALGRRDFSKLIAGIVHPSSLS